MGNSELNVNVLKFNDDCVEEGICNQFDFNEYFI